MINVRVCTRYIARVVTHDLIYVRVFTHDLIFVRVVTHDLIFVYVCCKRFDFVVHYTRFNSVRGVTHVILNVFFKTEWNKEKGIWKYAIDSIDNASSISLICSTNPAEV